MLTKTLALTGRGICKIGYFRRGSQSGRIQRGVTWPLPVPVGPPGASGVVGIPRVGGLGVHGLASVPRQRLARRYREVAGLDRRQAQRDLVGGLIRQEAIDWLVQEIDTGGGLAGVNLGSNPGASVC